MVVPEPNELPGGYVVVITGTPQLSVAVGGIQAAALEQVMMLAGQGLNTGGCVSIVCTVNEQLLLLLLSSVLVRVTVVVPTPVSMLPQAGTCTTTGMLQLSELLLVA